MTLTSQPPKDTSQLLMGPNPSKELLFTQKFMRDGAAIFREYYATGTRAKEFKADQTPVTVADEKINHLFIEMAQSEFPDHSIDGEEAGVKKDSPYVWVLDPIDGTIPFTEGLPISTISLALLKDGNPIVAAVYDPHSDRFCTAEKGKGAFINGAPVRVKNSQFSMRSGLLFDFWSSAVMNPMMAASHIAETTGAYTRNIGCATQAALMVLRGNVSACIFPGGEGKHVDVAATSLLITEAGGKVTDLDGNDQRYDNNPPINGCVLSNGVVHDQVIKAIKESK